MQHFDEFSSLDVAQAGKDDNVENPVVSRAGQGFSAFYATVPAPVSGGYGRWGQTFLQAIVVELVFE